MKLQSSHSFRPVRSSIISLLGVLLCLTTVFPCLAQQYTGKLPFDIFGEAIDNVQIYEHLKNNAILQKSRQAADAPDVIVQQLLDCKKNSDIRIDSLISQPLTKPEDLYQNIVKSTVFLGQFYDCGKCDRTHVSFSGGVMISQSGLALTNYHVMQLHKTGTTEGFMAMTYDGKCFEVEKVLAADKTADIALVQLKTDGHKFHAAPIAKTRPEPTSEVRIISHPAGEFFTLTKGEVSRYSRMRSAKRDSSEKKPAWLEVTADFGGGSSGGGVFNSQGELVGIVSRIRPLWRAASKTVRNGKLVDQPKYVEMVIRRCVNLSSIKACFGSGELAPQESEPQESASEGEPALATP